MESGGGLEGKGLEGARRIGGGKKGDLRVSYVSWRRRCDTGETLHAPCTSSGGAHGKAGTRSNKPT